MVERLVVAISSRALFQLQDSDQVYREQGVEAYRQYQIKHEDETLEPGEAFPLVKKLLRLNELFEEDLVDVILLSRNTADTGLRVFNSIRDHRLGIERAAFSGGQTPWRYAQAFGCQLFLSMEADDVVQALQNNVAAATLLRSPIDKLVGTQLRIAFDGDAVLFSDEAEQIYHNEGVESFQASEEKKARIPLPVGPFEPFMRALHSIQKQCDQLKLAELPIRTALVTARSAPAHERVVRTLRAWNIRVDESLFLGGHPKAEFLRSFEADIFFDDRRQECDEASQHLTTGHVPAGIKNQSPTRSTKN